MLLNHVRSRYDVCSLGTINMPANLVSYKELYCGGSLNIYSNA